MLVVLGPEALKRAMVGVAHCYMLCQSYPGPGFRSAWARGSGGCGFSKQVTAPTRLSCPGFSRGEGLVARSDSERSRGARRL